MEGLMTDFIEALKREHRNITVIGTSAIGDDEYWSDVDQNLFQKLDSGDLKCTVIAESDNQLFQHSLRTDTPYTTPSNCRLTYTQLKFRRELVYKALQKNDNRKQNSSFTLCALPLSAYLIALDNEIWYMPITAYPAKLERFKKLTQGDSWFEAIHAYMEKLLDKEKDGRFAVTPEKEMLELFDQDAIPRGIYPRDCFYGTDHYQFVIWDFVFNRDGKLLIHRRSANAKDNQDMWDKSVGGHIDFEKERSSSDAAVRELIEELYTKEKKEQSGHEFSLLSEDITKVLFLGDWRPNGCGPEYLDQIKLFDERSEVQEEPWVFYKIPGTISHNTPRILPDGSQRKLRVLADIFIFISNTTLSQEYAREHLKNSKFMLVEPSLLKTWIEKGQDDHDNDFKATPDLQYIMSGKLRNVIDEVSQIIKYCDFRK